MRYLMAGFGILIMVLALGACDSGAAVEEVPPPEAAEVVEAPAEEAVEEPPAVEEAPAVGDVPAVPPAEVIVPNVVRSTSLANYNVLNSEGEDLGDTEEILITLKDGAIDYLVLSFGGFLGMGESNFLIPWQAVEVAPEINAFFTDGLTREILESAPTFEPDAWPDTAAPDWDAEVRAFWEGTGIFQEQEPVAAPAAEPVTETEEITDTEAMTETEPADEAEEITDTEAMTETEPVDEAEEITDTEAMTETAPVTETEEITGTTVEGELTVHVPRSVRLSVLLDYTVRNPAGEELGALEDIVVNWQEGRAVYAVLSFGGFLGMGDKWFAIPLAAMILNPVEQTIVLDVDQEMLDVAPGFDRNNWPETANPDWDQEIREYWESYQQELEELQEPAALPEGDQLDEPIEAEATPTPAQ